MNANHAHVDPEKLKEFAGTLERLAARVTEHDASMATGIVRLGNSFRDDDYERFRARFVSSRQLLQRFVAEARKQIPLLRADADKIAAAQSVHFDR